MSTLRAARELISDPAKWTKYVLARNEVGIAVESRSPEAVCWCAIGACAKVGASAISLFDVLGKGNVTDFNDNRTHAEVLALFDRAIALEEQ